ncbi:MAG: hypothetical protein H7Y42_12945 [Chitinophagaceae bacterium]|nr:hypothetical protein [Chitinophagaceae bacterium]
MSKKQSSKKPSKKETRQAIYHKLVIALAEFRSGVSDKKFENNLKKASRLLGEGISKAGKKKKVKIKPPKEEKAPKDQEPVGETQSSN